MAVHPCPRCKRVLIPVGVAYCDECKPIAEQQAEDAIAHRQEIKRKKYNKAYNKKRDPKYLKFYRSKDWKTMSKAKLLSVGYRCEAKLNGCAGIACEVHHIQPIQTVDGWDRRLDWSNLEALCTACHNERHGGRWKRKDDGILDVRKVAQELHTPGGG